MNPPHRLAIGREQEDGGREGFYTPRPAMTPSAAPLSAIAQLDEILACLPFAALLALASAFLSAIFAFLSSRCAFLPEFDAAWSMRVSAVLNFPVTLAGMV